MRVDVDKSFISKELLFSYLYFMMRSLRSFGVLYKRLQMWRYLHFQAQTSTDASNFVFKKTWPHLVGKFRLVNYRVLDDHAEFWDRRTLNKSSLLQTKFINFLYKTFVWMKNQLFIHSFSRMLRLFLRGLSKENVLPYYNSL